MSRSAARAAASSATPLSTASAAASITSAASAAAGPAIRASASRQPERFPFAKVLIANRGEIAVRVIRACRDLGLGSVAVYSDADRTAPHVRMADEAVHLGPPAAAESYLNVRKILDAAKQTGAGAIHPGYGFLSENADFADACAEAGIVFVGPSGTVMRKLGEKTAAKRVAVEADVPIVPGYNAGLRDAAHAAQIAEEIGYPVLLKAAAGGGGKGIRFVFQPEELEGALRLARSEAAGAFGDDTVYMEKAVTPARHIEVQIFCDTHGNAIHLGERECSIQRRHQKLIEESPSVALDDDLRVRFTSAAVALARAAGYVNAGTVEFLLGPDRNFYFLEVNTRLQVEHPVTEWRTGLDLVREQLRVAAGLPLSVTQEDVAFRGHAIEARITAEDPFNRFLPASGSVASLGEPSGPGVRLDSGIYAGMQIPLFYDSLLAKLICWGQDRTEALARLRRALDEYTIAGVRTTIPFHQWLLDHPRFTAGDFSTDFIAEEWRPDEIEFSAPASDPVAANDADRLPPEVVAALTAALVAQEEDHARAQRRRAAAGAETQDGGSRWRAAGRRTGSNTW
ncbi:MAG: Biotin carboxylase of acetyl-CoA carboxylase [Ktedonobacterales bacterium]|jgi:acetyl-CoA carboxylase biotin carboxylase subunit|nr:MAG: Biotin carboxylase of acetyl-CoA carboxylase [Ktedonobacterales bacterium]